MNKLFCFAILMLNASISAYGLDAEVDAFKSAVATGDIDEVNQSLIQLNMAIQQRESVDQSPWNTPSPARLQRRQEIKNSLEPIKSDLIGLIQGDSNSAARNANVIIGFAALDNEVYSALKKQVKESVNASVATSALYSLYQLDAADFNVRNIAVERIKEYGDRSKSAVAFGLLNLSAVWPLPEVLPVCIDMLNSDAELSNKVIAAKAIMKLGSAGAIALPELESLLQALEQEGGDFRYINTVKRAIMLVSAKEGKNDVLLPASVATSNKPISTPNPVQQVQSEAEPVKQAKKKTFSPTFLIVTVVFALVLLLGTAIYCLRRE